MNRKTILALLLSICLLLASFAACAEEEFLEEEEIYVDFEAYGAALLRVTEDDWEGGTVESEYSCIGIISHEGTTIGELLEEFGFFSMTPVLEGDEFEGWMIYRVNVVTDEDGFEDWVYENISGDVLYTHEEVMAMPAPEESIVYVAKWASIPVEEYYTDQEADWGDVTITGTFTVLTEEGAILFADGYGGEAEEISYTYWPDEGQTLTELIASDKVWSTIADVRNEGKTFTGWTVYEATDILWQDEPSEGEEFISFLSSVYGDEKLYISLMGSTVYSESATTEELMELVVQGTNYVAVANWE